MRYDITISGDWDQHAAEMFDDVQVTRADSTTMLSADLDQAGLHGVLQRIRVCGFTLLDVRRRRGSRATSSPKSDPPTTPDGSP